MDVSVIIPAYNEEKTIGEVVRRILKICDAEVIVVDDASKDDTGKFAVENGAIVIRNSVSQGPSAAIRKGISRSHGKVIITIDADLDHLPEDIPKLLEASYNGADIVIGERDSLPRISERLLAFFTKIAISIKDPLSGFRVYNRRVLVNFKKGRIETYQMLFLANSLLHGFKIVGIPINTNGKARESRIGLSWRIDLRILVAGFLFFIYLSCFPFKHN